MKQLKKSVALSTATALAAAVIVGCSGDADESAAPSAEESAASAAEESPASVVDGTLSPVMREYAMDDALAGLRRNFEREWLRHVAGYTNYTRAGMEKKRDDMKRFANAWKRPILVYHAGKEADPMFRERMVDRMQKYNSIDELYYGLLVSHHEVLDRWEAFDQNKNARGRLSGVDVQFRNGMARWISQEHGKCEMSARLYDHYFWPVGDERSFAFVFTDVTSSFDGKAGIDALAGCWLGLFANGKLVRAQKLPCRDVRWSPNLGNAPYGRKFTLEFVDGNVRVVNCVTGEVVFSIDAQEWL